MFSFAISRATIVWLLTLLLFGIACAIPRVGFAAELLFSPTSGSHGVGSEFDVKVLVDPGGEDINSAEGVVSFDATTLSVTNVSQSDSAFSLWTTDPSYSNSAGTVTFSGGTPSAFSDQRTVITITFRGSEEGEVALSFSEGTVLAADGMGTDVYSGGGTANFTITEAAAEPTPPPPPPSRTPPSRTLVAGDPPDAPIVRSSSHEDPEEWYATSTIQLSWIVTADVTSIRLLLSEEEEAEPEEEHEPSVESMIFTDIEDGIWYAHVQFQNSFGWGEVSSKRMQVDTVPPEEFEIALIEDGEHSEEPKFTFKTEDALSGVDRYELMLNERVVTTIRAEDLEDGMHPVPPQEGGSQLVVIRAYDNAGNMRTAERTLDLPFVERRSAANRTQDEEDDPLITLDRILLLLFVFSTGVLAALNYTARKSTQEERSRILQEVSDIRDKNDRVFTAMREEFEQMIDDFDEKPQLSAAERDLLEKIKEVLVLSEELIDSDIEELKRGIRGQ